MMGYGDEGTLALSARLRYARRTPPFKTGRTTCTPLTGSVWRTYAAGFKLDRWEHFHHIKGDETDRAYLRIATLRKHYGRYRGKLRGEPPGPPSTIRIPHIKGTTPDRDVAPTESEFAGS